MNDQNGKSWKLALDLSAQEGEVAIVMDGQIVARERLTRANRHQVPLMPTLNKLSDALGLSPEGLAAIYVALGPGSFTGLRIAIATAKMLAQTTYAKTLGVPSADLIAFEQQAPAKPDQQLTICLNHKRGSVVASTYHWLAVTESWQPSEPASVKDWQALIAPSTPGVTPQQRIILTDRLPKEADDAVSDLVELRVDPDLCRPRCQALVELGETRAQAGSWTEPADLLPLYVRRPEAVEIWENRRKQAGAASGS